jgi:dolichol-phosphate mannosyltransferase
MDSKIPTDDPQAALDFCRTLNSLLSFEEVSASVARRRPPVISVVIPVYNEAQNLPLLFRRLQATLGTLNDTWEIVFVDDGSMDTGIKFLRELASTDARITLVELSRNFGHQVAISAGLAYARGEGVIIMDADLQDPPEVLPQFIDKWREGYDVVYAIRQKRKERFFKRLAYAVFYRLLKQLATIDIPLDVGDFCLMDRRVVDLLLSMPERNRFVRGIRSWVGLNQIGIAYERQARNAGISKYNFRRLLYLALDGLVSFSFIPLRMITVLGFSISGISLGLAVFYALKRVLVGLSPPGFASLMVVNFFFAGVQLITLGVIGEYVGRIFIEVKRRPLYVVRRVVGRERP